MMKKFALLPILFFLFASVTVSPGFAAEKTESKPEQTKKAPANETTPKKKPSRRAEYVKKYKETFNPKDYAKRYKEAYKPENYKKLYSRRGSRLLIPSLEELEKMKEAGDKKIESKPGKRESDDGIGRFSYRSSSKKYSRRNNRSRQKRKPETKGNTPDVQKPVDGKKEGLGEKPAEPGEMKPVKTLLPSGQEENNRLHFRNPYARYLYGQPQLNRARLRNATGYTFPLPGANTLPNGLNGKPEGEVPLNLKPPQANSAHGTVPLSIGTDRLPPGVAPMNQGNPGPAPKPANRAAAGTAAKAGKAANANTALTKMLSTKGKAAFSKRDYRKAYRNYSRLAALKPSDADVQTVYGLSLLGMGDYEKSVKAIQKGFDLAQSKQEKIPSLATHYANKKDYPFLKNKLERFVQRYPKNTPAKELLTLLAAWDKLQVQAPPKSK